MQSSTILMIPGIQGRWEWMRPAVDALRVNHQVLTFSLNQSTRDDECFDDWERHIDRLMDEAGVASAVLVGVSFGGIVALRYAAHRPERVQRLVLVSTPPPQWRLDARRAAYLRHPVLLAPLFALRGIAHLLPEIIGAELAWGARWKVLALHLTRVLRYPAAPVRMAAWTRAWQTLPQPIDCRRVTMPTLVVTGEPHLDRVVPTASSLEYLRLLPRVRHETLPGTGHIGIVTRPQAFATLVGEFIRASDE
jgi:3-oxoadipate enol-lactonase